MKFKYTLLNKLSKETWEEEYTLEELETDGKIWHGAGALIIEILKREVIL